MTQEYYQFEDIAPYPDSIFHEKMKHLVDEPGFQHAVRWVFPDIDYDAFKEELLKVKDKNTFQKLVMRPFLEMLASKTTSGISISGLERLNPEVPYTFITNHRDIVLDTSFLNLCFLRNNFPTTEVAIGSNLLVYEWINDLVRLNKSFIVKRDLPRRQALDAAQELSAYIHDTVGRRRQSVWIAEREGRSKDSSDMAQESLVKMLALGGGGTFKENLEGLNLMPVSISYEYDPNDYLKAREFLLRRNDPEFKKTQRDDLFAMETGLLQSKGRVHFTVGVPINDELKNLDSSLDKSSLAHEVCHMIDCQIHSGYEIFSINYIAFDELFHTDKFKDRYTAEEADNFKAYVKAQIAKIDIPELSEEDYAYLNEMMLTMYANPLKNNIIADDSCASELNIS